MQHIEQILIPSDSTKKHLLTAQQTILPEKEERYGDILYHLKKVSKCVTENLVNECLSKTLDEKNKLTISLQTLLQKCEINSLTGRLRQDFENRQRHLSANEEWSIRKLETLSEKNPELFGCENKCTEHSSNQDFANAFNNYHELGRDLIGFFKILELAKGGSEEMLNATFDLSRPIISTTPGVILPDIINDETKNAPESDSESSSSSGESTDIKFIETFIKPKTTTSSTDIIIGEDVATKLHTTKRKIFESVSDTSDASNSNSAYFKAPSPPKKLSRNIFKLPQNPPKKTLRKLIRVKYFS